MRVGLIGLGRMGYALALNMLNHKISVAALRYGFGQHEDPK